MSRGRHRAGAVAIGVLSLFALGAPAALAAFQGQNGRIVYVHIPHHSDNRGIYSARPSGKHRQRLSDGPFDGNPNVAPDGNRIVFDRAPHGDFEIWTMRANGHHKQRLTHGRSDVDPAFIGPSGSRIVFTRGPYHMVVMRADGSHVHRLHGTHRERMPASSPDGRWIAFSGRGRGSGWNIYVIHPNGHGLHRLTSRGGRDTNPDFSPGGDRVVFNRYDGSAGQTSLWVVRTDGSDLHRLPITNADYNATPAFSPSGRKITYDTAGSTGAIAVAWDDGSHGKRVITNWVNEMPNWGVSP